MKNPTSHNMPLEKDEHRIKFPQVR